MKLWQVAALVGCVVGFAGADVGVVSHVKILSDKNSDDVTSPEAWKKTMIKEGMTDQEKAIAIFKTIVKYRHQENPPSEGLQMNVHDPFKTFNVYGYGMCCCAASNLEGLARYIGMPARGRQINNHSVAEVWYNGGWRMLDPSLMFYVTKPDGMIASCAEMKQNIMDWKKDHPEIEGGAAWKNFGKDWGWKKGPSLFADSPFYDKDGINRAGWHGWWSNMMEFNYKTYNKHKIVVPPDTNADINIYDYGAIMGYQVNVQLREGEKLTRNWFATEVTTGLSAGGKQRLIAGDRRALGLQRDYGDMSPGRIGNGVLEYDAMADSQLAKTALVFENLKMEGGKLRKIDASKNATLIVRMPSSYVYLGGEMTWKPVVGSGSGGASNMSLSLNNGLDWISLPLQKAAGEESPFVKGDPNKVDLKPLIFNKYDYRVKLVLAGGMLGIDELKFVNRVQHSQAPLPVLLEGENKLTFTASKVAEGTVTVEGNMGGGKDAAWGRVLGIEDFKPILEGKVEMKRFAIGTTAKSDAMAAELDSLTKVMEDPPLRGSAFVPVVTPGDITRVRMGAHWRARNEIDGFIVCVSFDEGRSWKEWGKLDLAHSAKSTYMVFNDVPANSRNVLVKFDGTQSHAAEIFDLRIDVDYKEPAGGFRPVKVTYVWEEGVPAAAAAPAGKGKAVERPRGTEKIASHVCSSPEETWTIHCGPGTVVRSYTVELAK